MYLVAIASESLCQPPVDITGLHDPDIALTVSVDDVMTVDTDNNGGGCCTSDVTDSCD